MGLITETTKQIDFGAVLVGTSTPKTMTIVNRYSYPITIKGIECPEGVSLIGQSIVFIPAGEAALISLKYEPARTGALKGMISIAIEQVAE